MATSLRHLREADLVRVPWKNGRGTTLEIASDAGSPEAQADQVPWTWRVSIADVPESGPFSRFDGCERLIVCVEGRGMRLTIDGTPPVDVPARGEALRFPGEATTIGTLIDGPVRDGNVIVRRDRWQSWLALAIGGTHRVEPAEVAVVVALGGEATIVRANERLVLAKGEAALAVAPTTNAGQALEVSSTSAALLARVWHRP